MFLSIHLQYWSSLRGAVHTVSHNLICSLKSTKSLFVVCGGANRERLSMVCLSTRQPHRHLVTRLTHAVEAGQCPRDRGQRTQGAASFMYSTACFMMNELVTGHQESNLISYKIDSMPVITKVIKVSASASWRFPSTMYLCELGEWGVLSLSIGVWQACCCCVFLFGLANSTQGSGHCTETSCSHNTRSLVSASLAPLWR